MVSCGRRAEKIKGAMEEKDLSFPARAARPLVWAAIFAATAVFWTLVATVVIGWVR